MNPTVPTCVYDNIQLNCSATSAGAALSKHSKCLKLLNICFLAGLTKIEILLQSWLRC